MEVLENRDITRLVAASKADPESGVITWLPVSQAPLGEFGDAVPIS